MIAIDMDGTLLSSRGEISLANKKAIQQAQQKGVLVAIATGRSYEGAMRVLQPAGIICPVIHLNGARICSEEGVLLQSIHLDRQVALQIHQAFQEAEIYHELYTDEGIFSNRDGHNHLKVEMDKLQSANPSIQPEMLQMAAKKQFQQAEVTERKHLEDVIVDSSFHIYKMLAFSMIAEKLAEARTKVSGLEGIVLTASAGNNIEINHREAQKGIALERLAQQHRIPAGQTMAIGDNRNDLSMLKIAGVSVAMGNADQEVREVCDYVTQTNDEDGVAKAIEKFI
nr:Cof-type HAD-IIB family hydrolase [Paenactinomyces guangxiensis]